VRILLFSATELGKQCISVLLNAGCELAGIVTVPQEFAISYASDKVRNYRHVSFEEIAIKENVPLLTHKTKLVDLKDDIESISPDLILVAGWYHMVPKVIREIPRKGCVGIHASLLPKYRGGAPLVWAMINGEEKTGVTLFHLGEGVDKGDIVGQREFNIAANDTIADLIEKTGRETVALLETCIPMISSGVDPRVVQDESKVSHFPQRSPEDGKIDWSWSADVIERFIRAQTKPYPGAFTEINGKRIIIWDAQIEDSK